MRSPNPNGASDGSASATLVDWQSALDAVQGDEDLLRELVDTFAQEGPEQLDEMQRAWERKDPPILSRMAHTLKGSLRFFGAATAANLAQQLESLPHNGELRNVDSLLSELRSKVARVLTELLNWPGRSSTETRNESSQDV